MKRFAVLALVTVMLGGAGAWAQEAPKMPAPQKEHEWLHQLAGEWETEAEMVMEPGQPPVKSLGTESTRLLGGFWIVSEMKGDCLGVPVTGLMTVGYNPQKQKYVGTWVCSMCDWLCEYEGTVDGRVLTLNCEGPSPSDPGKLVKMRDVIELKDKDHKVLTSYLQDENGQWIPFMTMNARRTK